ncbi:uncharacterized protein LOC110702646 isoform X3 [Chenopodium quinoa]|uniref:uncharacterized protein LOC110702646 isoform X3 n=1 Tax=Chenopodium quinoa TaxID=63459 RepID=UPI000B796B92|nr:uncharacterized protein LOC110702646 isoform X3 [Chenopodium quinoa]
MDLVLLFLTGEGILQHWPKITLFMLSISLDLVHRTSQQDLCIQWKHGQGHCRLLHLAHFQQLLLDFLNEVVQEPAVLIGNSVGSLACVISAAESCQRSQPLVSGLVLLNCSGGMNNKAIVDDWRIKLLLPVLWLIDFLLQQKPIASALFERVKQRENLRNVLLSVYGCKESVDDTLVEIIKEPADGEGALDAFVSIVTGPPGPSPVKLMPRITIPVLVLWGDQDPFSPLDGPVGRYFTSLPSSCPNVTLSVLSGVGHCPHDDKPALVHEKLLPWLSDLPAA